jgi:hypothetical protein
MALQPVIPNKNYAVAVTARLALALWWPAAAAQQTTAGLPRADRLPPPSRPRPALAPGRPGASPVGVTRMLRLVSATPCGLLRYGGVPLGSEQWLWRPFSPSRRRRPFGRCRRLAASCRGWLPCLWQAPRRARLPPGGQWPRTASSPRLWPRARRQPFPRTWPAVLARQASGDSRTGRLVLPAVVRWTDEVFRRQQLARRQERRFSMGNCPRVHGRQEEIRLCILHINP